MQFSNFVRTVTGNTILIKNEIAIEAVGKIKYFTDNSSGTFLKKEVRWSFTGTYWSAWEPLTQRALSSIDTHHARYMFLEIRYVLTAAGSGNVTNFVINYTEGTVVYGDVSIPVEIQVNDSSSKLIHDVISKYKVFEITDACTLNGYSGSWYLDRRHHTGTQPISSISGIQDIFNLYVKKSGDTMSGPLAMSNKRITDLAWPIDQYDAVNKFYVDSSFISRSEVLQDFVKKYVTLFDPYGITEFNIDASVHNLGSDFTVNLYEGEQPVFVTTRVDGFGNLRLSWPPDSVVETIRVILYGTNNFASSTADASLFHPLGGSPLINFQAKNLTVDSSLIVWGNLIQNGSSYTTHTEQVFVKNDFITLRDNAVSALQDGSISGLRIMIPDGSNNVILGTTNDSIMRIGWENDSLLALAAREDFPIPGGYAFWDDSSVMFKTMPIDFVKESSLGTAFVWNAGLLDVSIVSGYTTSYIDGSLNNKVSKTGDTMSGNLTINASLFVNGNVDVSGNFHTTGAANIDGSLNIKLSSAAVSNYFSISSVSGNSDILVCSSSGKIGIGGAAGTQKLHVNSGSISVNDQQAFMSYSYGSVGFWPHLTTIPGFLGGRISSYNSFMFTLWDGVDYNEKLRIVGATGNVGIGIPNPSTRLDVSGNFHTTGSVRLDASLYVAHDTYLGDSSTDVHTVIGNMNISGNLTATTKSFLITHPLDHSKTLQYGNLEGPEHGIYVRGQYNSNKIILPDYWKAFIKEESISINLTSLNKWNIPYVKKFNSKEIKLGKIGFGKYSGFYTIFAERSDVAKLIVEK
jgi:hypothetical protein